MHRRISSFLAVALLPAAAAAAPGDTGGASAEAERSQQGETQSRQQSEARPQFGQPGQQERGDQQAGQTDEVNLIATDELIGREVTTQEGERLGTLQFVTVSLDQGNISHLIVDTSGTDFAPDAPARGAPEQPGTPGPSGTPGQPGGQAGTPGQPGATSQAGTTTPPGQEQPGQDQPGQNQPGQDRPAQDQPGADRQPQTAQQGPQQGERNLLIVPWSVADVQAQDDQVVIAATGRHITNAPTLAREELNQLTEPAVASYVVDYWAPATEMAALESERRQPETQSGQRDRQQDRQQDREKNRQDRDQRQMQQQDQTQDPQRQPDQARADDSQRMRERQDVGGTSQPSSPDEALAERSESAPVGELARSERRTGQTDPQQSPEQARERAQGQPEGQAQDQTQEQSQPQIGQPGQSSRQPGSGNQVVLVGQEVVAAVTPPMFQLGKQLRGASVLDRSGQEIGEIRQIMIDTDSGDAAFAVIEGTSAGSAPVPLQALEWSAEGTTTLMADTSNLQSSQGLTEQPDQASRQELEQLYQRFGAQPYWDRAGTSGQPTPRGSSGELPQ